MPAWRQGMAVGEWRQVSGTALSAAPMAVKTYPSLGNTGAESKVIAWTGFAIDTRDSSVYSPANGGHHDYAGNEVNRIRLTDNAPAWSEPRASTPVAQVVDSATHYADGRPTARHTYYGARVNEVRNRIMTFSGSRYGNGGMVPTVDGFNLTSNDWDGAGTFPNIPSDFANTPGTALVDQKSSGDVYAFAQFNVFRWSSASNSWSTQVTGTPIYGQYAATALDTRRNRILLVGGENNDYGVYDIAANTMQRVTLSGADAAALGGAGNGMVYDPLLDVYLLRKPGAGATIYRINAQNFSVDTLPTSAGAQVPASTNGVWTRFLYVPSLKGVVYFPTYTGNLWFVRTF